MLAARSGQDVPAAGGALGRGDPGYRDGLGAAPLLTGQRLLLLPGHTAPPEKAKSTWRSFVPTRAQLCRRTLPAVPSARGSLCPHPLLSETRKAALETLEMWHNQDNNIFPIKLLKCVKLAL